jgi:hypothetical protein
MHALRQHALLLQILAATCRSALDEAAGVIVVIRCELLVMSCNHCVQVAAL